MKELQKYPVSSAATLSQTSCNFATQRWEDWASRGFTNINSQFSEVRYSSVAFAISPSAYISRWKRILTYRIIKDVLLCTKHDYLNDIDI